MRRLPLFPVFGLLFAGCSRGGVKPLAGDWSGLSSQTKSELVLAEDKTMYLFGANDFVAGIASGTYDQSEDRLALNITRGGISSASYKYRWLGPDRIGLSLDVPGAKEEVFVRVAKARHTATLPGGTSGATPPTATPPIDEAKLHDTQLATTCLSNIKQLGMAQALYAADWDDTLPEATAWAINLYPYTKNQAFFTCPALSAQGQEGGYAMDSRLSGVRRVTIADPKAVILLFESLTTSVGAADPQSSLLPQPRHGGKISVAYLDGHGAAIEK